MGVKYYTPTGGVEILLINIIRETDDFVYMSDGARAKKNSQWGIFHETFRDAHNFLVMREQSALDEMVFLMKQQIKKVVQAEALG